MGKKRKEKAVECLESWLDNSGKLVNTERLWQNKYKDHKNLLLQQENKLSLGTENVNLFEGTYFEIIQWNYWNTLRWHIFFFVSSITILNHV